MSIKSIKEKELLVNFAKSLGQEIDPRMVEEVERLNQIKARIQESVKENVFIDLSNAIKNKPKEKEVVVIEQNYPVPPSLDELMALIESKEEVNELVQTQATEEPTLTEEANTETPDEPNPESIEIVKETSLADVTAKFISESPKDSFQQPDPLPVPGNLAEIQKKLKFLEQWVGKISMAGPGGGEVKLRFLDDIDRSTIGNGKYLNYNSTTGKFQFSTLSGGGTEADTLDTVTTRGNYTENSITVKNANANYFAVNTSADYTVTTGQIAWNPADLTFDMGMANGVTLQVGQEHYIKVKANENITNGDAVMFAGANGEHILAAPNNMSVAGYRPEWFIGVATQDIALNGFGYITTFGKVHDVNTLAFTVGDILYANRKSTRLNSSH